MELIILIWIGFIIHTSTGPFLQSFLEVGASLKIVLIFLEKDIAVVCYTVSIIFSMPHRRFFHWFVKKLQEYPKMVFLFEGDKKPFCVLFDGLKINAPTEVVFSQEKWKLSKDKCLKRRSLKKHKEKGGFLYIGVFFNVLSFSCLQGTFSTLLI